MSDRSNIIYVYDGSYEGFLCAVFDAYQRKEVPTQIVSEQEEQPSLFAVYQVETDAIRANRVAGALYEKISAQGEKLVRYGFLTCLPNREDQIFDFIRFALKKGRQAPNYLTEPCVDVLTKAVKALTHEAHLFTGFVRFTQINRVLVSEIEPKNCVLTVMAGHFCERFNAESFLIVDRTHKMALAHSKGKSEIFPYTEFELPPEPVEERHIKSLWKCFFETVAIEGRINPRCQRGHMPKRFWGKLHEFQ